MKNWQIYGFFSILILGFLLISGCTGSSSVAPETISTPTTAVNYYKTVDVSALQAKYGIYGSCSDISRTALEISHNDEIYKCSDPKKTKQLGNQNCYFNGYYIDNKVNYDLASLTGEVCKREQTNTKTPTINQYQYCRETYPGTTYNPSTNTCEYLSQKQGITTIPTTQFEVVQPTSHSSSSSPTIDIPTIEGRVHEMINQHRRNQGLSSLRYDSSLAAIARKHSEDMARNNYFDHENLQGLSPTDRGNMQGYTCRKDYGSYYTYRLAENIYQNNLYDSVTYYNGIPSYDWNPQEEIAQSTVDGWMDSPGHRKNILTSSYDREGIGVAVATDDKVYITQDFC
ncbi:CAP domain-containing protein [Candidatus Bathyarchaeota archaeon]|nr:CAP domain-containing protein [Candidatus Bathyarchaeota archaeon]